MLNITLIKKAALLLTLLLSLVVPAQAKNVLLAHADPKEAGKYVRKHFVELLNKPFDETNEANDKKKAILIGDSHAQDFLNMVTEAKRLDN